LLPSTIQPSPYNHIRLSIRNLPKSSNAANPAPAIHNMLARTMHNLSALFFTVLLASAPVFNAMSVETGAAMASEDSVKILGTDPAVKNPDIDADSNSLEGYCNKCSWWHHASERCKNGQGRRRPPHQPSSLHENDQRGVTLHNNNEESVQVPSPMLVVGSAKDAVVQPRGNDRRAVTPFARLLSQSQAIRIFCAQTLVAERRDTSARELLSAPSDYTGWLKSTLPERLRVTPTIRNEPRLPHEPVNTAAVRRG
ncbi:hypothetical protein MJO29_010648, partial [Puccinia striiformis f. sp. tritici]